MQEQSLTCWERCLARRWGQFSLQPIKDFQMIAQISTGEGFGGLVNYTNDIIKKDTVIIASYGVNLSSNATITASFKAQAKARPTI
jgi:hypothetical protein